MIGVIAFFLQNVEKQFSSFTWILFFSILGISLFLIIRAIYFFVRSWFGNTYCFLPSAGQTEEYRKKLVATYAPYEQGAELTEKYLNDYLCQYFIDCSTTNTHCNDKRSIYLHKTNGTLVLAAVTVFLAFLCFYFGNLDKSHNKQPTEINIINWEPLREAIMTNHKEQDNRASIPPPPPPAPPPARQIKEGVEVIKPQPEEKK